jgi:FlgD Ig-like domain
VTTRLPTVFVVVLIVATGGAFARTELLKLETNPVSGPRVDKQFSPVCRCATDRAHISFRLRRADHLTLSIVDSKGHTVVRLVDDRALRAGRVTFVWNGRDADGNVVPEGSYRPKLELATHHRTIVLPDPMRVDTTPPKVHIVSAKPLVISPDGDGRADGVHVTYTVSEPARAILLVDGTQRVQTLHRPLKGVVSWYGRVGGHALPPGAHHLRLVAVDEAGNRTEATPGITVRIRYITLLRKNFTVRTDARFGVRYEADARDVRWRFAGRTGTAHGGRIVLTSPKHRGTFALVVAEHGHAVRTEVYVGGR